MLLVTVKILVYLSIYLGDNGTIATLSTMAKLILDNILFLRLHLILLCF